MTRTTATPNPSWITYSETASAADATRHASANSYLLTCAYVGDAQVGWILLLLLDLAIVFRIGFRETVDMATAVAIPY